MVKEIKEKEFQKLVIDSKKKVLVDCYATWCGPCMMLAPIIEEVSGENTEYEFYKLDVDNAEEISMKYGIMSIPTLGLIEKEAILELLK